MKMNWKAGMMAVLVCSATGAESPAQPSITWDATTTVVFAPKTGGVWYPRLLKQRNGTLLCAFDTNADSTYTYVQIAASKDGGKTWANVSHASSGAGNAANGQLTELADGALLCAYRLVNGETKMLKVARSADGGKTWADWSVLATAPEGVWEPHLLRLSGGVILAFYATETRRPQAIVLKRSTDGGKTWGKEELVAAHSRSRDGMPVAARLPSGKIIVTFEAQDLGNPFVTRAVLSTDDGKTWGPRRLVYQPGDKARRASAPYVVALSEKTLVASFQTDEDHDGFGDGSCDMKTVVSRDGGLTWSVPSAPFADPHATAVWNALFVVDSRTVLAATSTTTGGRPKILLRRGRLSAR